jgi:hypothetical protein
LRSNIALPAVRLIQAEVLPHEAPSILTAGIRPFKRLA